MQERTKQIAAILAIGLVWFYGFSEVPDKVSPRLVFTPPLAAKHLPKSKDVIRRAHNMLRRPYVWGEESYKRGFDCSGLVAYCYRFRCPRTVSELNNCRRVRPQAGAIILLGEKELTHCGIVVSVDPLICIHASSSRGVVKEAPPFKNIYGYVLPD